ncbi:hypothetical protein ACMHYO_16175 [Allopusillimonas ginsengisoli]|uniref:hypothetical protein n=1 Tax=Allopusillimonas ginsengisoli TaxID=453575 RepID=UPI0039C23202
MLKPLLVCALLVVASLAHAELMLFGGKGHDVFLGCVDCSPYSSNSICNESGQYGSEYRDTIWNAYREYGSEYRDTSPWNPYTSSKNVPILVNKKGDFFGYFTINEFRSDAVNFANSLKKMFENANGDLPVVRNLLCDALH